MKAIAYARVSSREQEETGYSLDAQENFLNEYASRAGLEIAQVFKVAESASGAKQRKTFQEMMNLLDKQGIKILICEKTDRLTRSRRDAVLIDEWVREDSERQIHFAKENFILTRDARANERLMWGLKVEMAQYYINNLSEEVRKGQKQKIQEGWLPTKPPLGYKTIGDKGKKIHILDEVTAPFIKALFEKYATGLYSIEKLTNELYQEGLRSRTGGKVVKGRIHDIMFDPFYYGKIRWLEKIYDGQQEPLISKELFEKVGGISSSRTTPVYSTHSYVFKGLMKCTECNGTITWEVQKGIVYGHCSKYRACSKRPYYKEMDLDGQIAKVFQTLQIKNKRLAGWIKQALQESHKGEVELRINTVKSLQNQLARIQQRLDNLYDDRLDERIDTATYDSKSASMRAERDSLDGEIKRHGVAGDKQKEFAINIFDLSQRAGEIYARATLDEKRRLIKFVFESMEIDDGLLKFNYTKPFEILASAVLETNGSKEANSILSPISIFELFENGPDKGKTDLLQSVYPIWLRG